MLRKKYKEIIADFVRLPYIIYKNRFFIPQRPIKPKYNFLIGMNGNIIGSFQKSLPEMVNLELINRANDPNQQKELIDLYKEEMNKKMEQYQEQIQEYQWKYLYPLMIPSKACPAIIYFRHHRESVLQELEKQGKTWNFAELNRIFNDKHSRIRQQYSELAQKQHQARLKIHQQTKELYKIPEFKQIKPYYLYRHDMKGKQGQKFIDLSQQVKSVYIQKAAQINKERERRLINFLNERNLTLQDFNRIRQVCNQIQNIKKEMKKRENNRTAINQQEQYDQNTPQPKKIQPKEEQEEVEIRSKPIKEPSQTQQPLQSVEKKKAKGIHAELDSDDDNFDFNDEELNIFQLKRLSQNKHKEGKH